MKSTDCNECDCLPKGLNLIVSFLGLKDTDHPDLFKCHHFAASQITQIGNERAIDRNAHTINVIDVWKLYEQNPVTVVAEGELFDYWMQQIVGSLDTLTIYNSPIGKIVCNLENVACFHPENERDTTIMYKDGGRQLMSEPIDSRLKVIQAENPRLRMIKHCKPDTPAPGK